MDSPLELRIVRLEATIGDIREALTRIEERQAAMVGTMATAAQLDYLRGRVESLPTAWTMVTGIIAGQVALAGLIAAVVFGVAHLMGRM